MTISVLACAPWRLIEAGFRRQRPWRWRRVTLTLSRPPWYALTCWPVASGYSGPRTLLGESRHLNRKRKHRLLRWFFFLKVTGMSSAHSPRSPPLPPLLPPSYSCSSSICSPRASARAAQSRHNYAVERILMSRLYCLSDFTGPVRRLTEINMRW